MSLPNLSSLKPRTEIKLRAAVSEPIFRTASLLDTDYIHAAALLSTLVAETLLVPHSEAKRLNASDQVLRLVYDTLKYLPFIDVVLVKSQFLVYHPQFLESLSLVKILIGQCMKDHFQFIRQPAIQSTPHATSQDEKIDLEELQDLVKCLKDFKIKLAAAYARVRIEHKATGDNFEEMIRNLLPEKSRSHESLSEEIHKCFRWNSLKTTKEKVTQELLKMNLQQGDDFEFDQEFDYLIHFQADLFNQIKESSLVSSGLIIFEDKALSYAMEHIKKYLKKETHVIDARAGSGTRVCHLAALLKNKGHIYAFEHRPSKLESLKLKIKLMNVKSKRKNLDGIDVTVIEKEFHLVNPKDYDQVKVIVCEPFSTGNAIVDKYGYLLQEEEYPSEHANAKDLISLRLYNVSMLKHALKFPSVNSILYMTRSINTEENETPVKECLTLYCKNEWELDYVMPDLMNDEQDLEECLKIHPSQQGNGIFVACFKKLNGEPDTVSVDEADLVKMSSEITLTEETLKKSKKPKRGKKKRPQDIKPRALAKFQRVISERLMHGGKKVDPQYLPPEMARIMTAQAKLKQNDSPRDSIATLNNDTEPTLKKISFFEGLEIFGVGLNDFYGPKTIAMKERAAKPSRFQVIFKFDSMLDSKSQSMEMIPNASIL